MSFFFKKEKRKPKKGNRPRRIDLRASTKEEMHKHGCKVCPLDKARLEHGKMQPTGPSKTDLYVLGEAPGAEEDSEGVQFIGPAGKIIRNSMRGDDDLVRWNNTIRCRPPGNRNPAVNEVECCRQYITKDIEEVSPYAVIGTGNIPLKHYLGIDTISMWRGLRFPVKIGNHVCWYCPIFHPSFLNYRRKKNKYTGEKITSELDLVFQRDMDRIFDWLEQGVEPEYLGDLSREDHLENCEWVFGEGQSDFRKVEKWLERMADKEVIGFDWETTDIRPYEKGSRILSLGISDFAESYSFPVDHPEAWGDRLGRRVMDLVYEFMMHSGTKIAHNLEFELEWGAYHFDEEILRGTKWDDTWAYSFSLDERKRIHSLDNLVFRYFGFWLKQFSNVNRANMIAEPLHKVLPYNALDAKYTFALREKLIEEIREPGNEGLEEVAKELVRTSPSIVRTQLRGLHVDHDARNEFKKEFKLSRERIERKIKKLPEVRKYQAEYGTFNPNSPDQVRVLIRDVLNRREGYKKDKKGEYDYNSKYSADEDTLKSIPKSASRAPELILDLRQGNKLDSTYCDVLVNHIFPDDLIHCSYKTKWVSTLRTACEDPNMQNWPKKRRKDLRRMIVAPKGYLLYCFDYGQIQARGIATMSEDEGFCRALWNKLDIHRQWAENINDAYPAVMDNMILAYGRKPEQVDDDAAWGILRDAAKNRWVFPLFFGSTKESCKHDLQLRDRAVNELYDAFWKEFGGVKKWHNHLKDFYNEHGYVASLAGARRRAPLRVNEIINSPIQGFERDIVLDAWNNTDEAGYCSVLEVHDDLSFYLPIGKKGEQMAEEIASIMVLPNFEWISVPIVLEVTRGPNWYDQEDWKEFTSDQFGHTPDNSTVELIT